MLNKFGKNFEKFKNGQRGKLIINQTEKELINVSYFTIMKNLNQRNENFRD